MRLFKGYLAPWQTYQDCRIVSLYIYALIIILLATTWTLGLDTIASSFKTTIGICKWTSSLMPIWTTNLVIQAMVCLHQDLWYQMKTLLSMLSRYSATSSSLILSVGLIVLATHIDSSSTNSSLPRFIPSPTMPYVSQQNIDLPWLSWLCALISECCYQSSYPCSLSAGSPDLSLIQHPGAMQNAVPLT